MSETNKNNEQVFFQDQLKGLESSLRDFQGNFIKVEDTFIGSAAIIEMLSQAERVMASLEQHTQDTAFNNSGSVGLLNSVVEEFLHRTSNTLSPLSVAVGAENRARIAVLQKKLIDLSLAQVAIKMATVSETDEVDYSNVPLEDLPMALFVNEVNKKISELDSDIFIALPSDFETLEQRHIQITNAVHKKIDQEKGNQAAQQSLGLLADAVNITRRQLSDVKNREAHVILQRIAQATEATALAVEGKGVWEDDNLSAEQRLQAFEKHYERHAKLITARLEAERAVHGNEAYTQHEWTAVITQTGIRELHASAQVLQESFKNGGDEDKANAVAADIDALMARYNRLRNQVDVVNEVGLFQEIIGEKIQFGRELPADPWEKDGGESAHPPACKALAYLTRAWKDGVSSSSSLVGAKVLKKVEEIAPGLASQVLRLSKSTQIIDFFEAVYKFVTDDSIPTYYEFAEDHDPVQAQINRMKAMVLKQKYVEPAKAVRQKLFSTVQAKSKQEEDEFNNFDEWKQAVLANVEVKNLQTMIASLVGKNESDLLKDYKTLADRLIKQEEATRQAINTDPSIPTYTGTDSFNTNYLQATLWEPYEQQYARLKIPLWETKSEQLRTFLNSKLDIIEDAEQVKRLEKKTVTSWAAEYDALVTQIARAEILNDSYRTNPVLSRKVSALERDMTLFEQFLGRADTFENLPPPETLSLDDLTDKLIENNADPFRWPDWKAGPESRLKEYVQYWKKHVFDEPVDYAGAADVEKERNRIYNKIRLQLHTLDNQLMLETGKATGDRSQLYQEVLNQRIISRRELMAAATHNTKHGKQVRDMLRWVIEHAAIRKGQKVKSAYFGRELEHIPAIAYTSLISENGRTNLDNYLAKQFSFENMVKGMSRSEYVDKPIDQLTEDDKKKFTRIDAKRARWFASKLFTSFDMLSISLRELQKATQTRGHNGGIDDDNHALFQEPLSSIHDAQRYGGADKYWGMHWLIYLKMSKSEAEKKNVRIGAGGDIHSIMEVRDNLIAQQESSFSTRKIAGQIELMEFCQAYFPDEYNWVTMHESETMREGNDVVDAEGNLLVSFSDSYLGRHVDPSKSGDFEIRNVFGYTTSGQQTLVGKIIKENGIEEWYKIEKTATGYVYRAGKLSSAKVTSRGKEVSFEPDVTNMDLYALAETGWKSLLELTFMSLPKSLSDHDVLEEFEHGKKGGLLNKWFSAAGKVKMFPGHPLYESSKNAMVPMLTHFIYRIFDHYGSSDVDDRITLFRGIVKQLKWSVELGGLERFPDEINQIIENISYDSTFSQDRAISDTKYARAGMSSNLMPRENREVRRRASMNWLRRWWHEEKAGIKAGPNSLAVDQSARTKYGSTITDVQGRVQTHEYIPMVLGGNVESMARITRVLGSRDTNHDKVELELIDYIEGRRPMPQAVARSGDMKKSKEAA